MEKIYYTSVKDKRSWPIQGASILVQDGDVYDRFIKRGTNTKWRKAYMLPRNVKNLGIEFKRGDEWPLKIKYRGYVLDRITDCKIVNQTGPK